MEDRKLINKRMCLPTKVSPETKISLKNPKANLLYSTCSEKLIDN